MTSEPSLAPRYAVLLGQGRYADERAGFGAQEGPRPEFIAIAAELDADIFSLASAKGARGRWLRRLASRSPHIGSAVNFALSASPYRACYVTGEEVGLPAAVLLRALGWRGRIVCVVHNLTAKKARLLRLAGHGMFAAFVVVSERQARALVERGGVPAAKVVPMKLWVDDCFFTPNREPSPAGSRTRVVTCGAENRDYPTLIEAAQSLDADIRIYGHGFFGSGENKAAPQPNVRHMPRVPFDELRSAYRDSDLVALPLNDVDYAAGATGLVEAMACGRPVVVTRTRGLADYFAAIDADAFAEPGDPASLARAIRHVAGLPGEARARAGRRHRRWIEQNCGVDRYAARISRLMRWGCSTPAGGGPREDDAGTPSGGSTDAYHRLR